MLPSRFTRSTRACGRACPPSAVLLLSGCLLFGAGSGFAQRDLTDIPEPDPEAELRDFEVADGFEVSLFAADPMIRKPIQIAFDARGRLWVAGSAVYPQIQPGQKADDEIVILEDVDRDGKADKSTVFAGGFLIPTGVLPGDDGAYVANSTDLVHLRDTDGDGAADERTIVLSGFGTEDTHHIIHAFAWGPAGELFFNQSIYIHSHVETPWGIRRLNGGGVWRFQPDSLELEVFTRGMVNPWGHVFDDWGQSFMTDGAYGEGINFTFPGAQYVTAVDAARILTGLNSGEPKHCGLARISGRHFPEEWQGHMIANDFRANRVNRFAISDAGSGFASVKQEDLLRSKRVTFRPVDSKIGPDGALYIADWYNPIIQHGEVDFRDERRDQQHGRIWRVTAKGRPLAPIPDIEGSDTGELLGMLKAPEQWTRSQARLRLTRLDPGPTATAVRNWVAGLDKADPQFEHLRLQALWVLQGLDVFDAALLDAVLSSPEPRARTAAWRAVFWGYADGQPGGDLLAARAREAVADPHPRVRLEVVRELGKSASLENAAAALRVLDQPVDRFLEYALWLTVRETAPAWLPAAADDRFDVPPSHLLYALRAVNSPETAGPLTRLLASGRLEAGQRGEAADALGALAGPAELADLLAIAAAEGTEASLRRDLFAAMTKAANERGSMPADGREGIVSLLKVADPGTAAAAARLAGAWKLASAAPVLTQLASGEATERGVRLAAVQALGGLEDAESLSLIGTVAAATSDPEIRSAALTAMAGRDLGAGARLLASLLPKVEDVQQAPGLFAAVLSRKGGVEALTAALEGVTLSQAIAEAGIRSISAAGLTAPELEARLKQSGGLDAAPMQLDEAGMRALVAEVESSGDAARGEQIYRRQALLCLQCHAIAGAGGRVGPDLVSIGASAPIDYLVDSLIDPNKKVKEGYHLTTVTTKDGGVFAGTGARRTDTHLVLINAANQDQQIPLDAIATENIGKSLMPAGLTASLSRAEFVDLVRFLHDLGRVPEFSVGSEPIVRSWALKIGDDGRLPVYSTVSGDVPIQEVAAIAGDGNRAELQFAIEVAEAGEVAMRLNDPAGVMRVIVGGTILSPGTTVSTPLEPGVHTCSVVLNLPGRGAKPLKVSLDPGSAGRARILTAAP